MRNLGNMELHELIGLDVRVVKSTNPLQVGICGKVIDESKNMLVIMSSMGPKKIQKKGVKFEFEIDGKTKLVDGDVINYRPHERTKKLIWRRRKW